MRLYLGGFFAFYIPSGSKPRRPWVEVDLSGPTALSEVLVGLGIPPAEVSLVAINGQAVEPAEAVINPGDEVRLYPPIGGG
jgi:sulfur carrier protein ThiS